MAARPPPQPSYIFRGHTSQIHSVHIVHRNSRLLTGDADGWVVCWKLESKRPVAVWRAHHASILGLGEWGFDNIITHGRDNSLKIWQLRAMDESNLSTRLPADSSTAHRPSPWLLHSLPVNTLNFCAFSMCYVTSPSHSILIAVPSRDDKKIEVYQFPDEKLVSFVPRVQTTDTGMVMAVKLAHHQSSNNILVIAGYEGGFTAVYLLELGSQVTGKSISEFAKLIYLSQPHTQPVLSLDVTPDATMYFTSSADAVIAAHRIPEIITHIHHGDEPESIWRQNDARTQPAPEASTRIAEDLTVAEEAEFMALLTTEDTSISPSSSSLPSSSPPLPTIDTPLSFTKQPISSSQTPPAGLSSLLSTTSTTSSPFTNVQPNPPPSPFSTTVQPPYKIASTKHAGQQSLSVRSDGRLFATGGWDSRIRVYSAKTLKEVACLKWHKEGVYAVGFGVILDDEDGVQQSEAKHTTGLSSLGGELAFNAEVAKSAMDNGLSKFQKQREEQIRKKHWLVAGSKDGKVSLWEIF